MDGGFPEPVYSMAPSLLVSSSHMEIVPSGSLALMENVMVSGASPVAGLADRVQVGG